MEPAWIIETWVYEQKKAAIALAESEGREDE